MGVDSSILAGVLIKSQLLVSTGQVKFSERLSVGQRCQDVLDQG